MTTVVKVFLASPGDLTVERQTVRERAEHFNRMWSDEFRVHFRVVGWEDVPPVAQRPQRRINRDADDCHLFVGLMGTRWGTGTGEFTSGFEEEFVSARQRWKETSVPEIALFFKSIDPAQSADPGAQLTKVIEFRKSITEGREFFYKEFSTSAQLSDFVDGVFAEYAKARRNAESSHVTTSPEQSASQSTTAGDDDISIDHGSIERVLSLALEAEAGTTSSDLDFWGRLRLWLHATVLFRDFRPHLNIGVHEANLVYRVRFWALSPAERTALVDSMLSEPSHYTPGWVWLSDQGLDVTRDRLWKMCLTGGESKKGAAALLAVDDKIAGSIEDIRSLLEDEIVSPLICRLLGRCGTMEHLPLLSEVGARVEEARKRSFAKAEFKICRRHQPEITLDAAYKYVNAGVKEALSVLTSKLLETSDPEVSTSELALISNERYRAVAAEQVLAAKRMSESSASALLKDPAQVVRAVALKALVTFGRTFSRKQIADIFPESSHGGLLSKFMSGVDMDELTTAGMRNLSVVELRGMVEFFSTDGRYAFQVLAMHHWDTYSSEVAKQLDEEFTPLIQEGEQKALSKGYSLISLWTEKEDLVEFVRGNFLRSALEAVAHHGHPNAKEWVQRYSALERPSSVRIGALRLQLSLREAPDYSAILLNLGDFPADLVAQLIPGFLTSLKPELKVVEAIAKAADAKSRNLLRRSLGTAANKQWHEVLVESLNSATDKARQIAALVLCDISSHHELTATLDSYLSQATYYYDVVAIFDWHIYGLDPYRAAIGEVTSFG